MIGHSTGGMLGARYALMYPEMVAALVLVNPIGLEDWKALGVPYRTVDDEYRAREGDQRRRGSAPTSARPITPASGGRNTNAGCTMFAGMYGRGRAATSSRATWA